uniref:Uncharacterized protein n=1 Tax=Schistosoma mansoni TaxID=6183 RepID=A0A5K4F8G0_SCHMA
MVCLVWFHVAALLLLLHTSTQTDVESNQLEDLKAEISYSEEQMDLYAKKINASDSEMQSLRDKITKADPQKMKNIDRYTTCRSEYWISLTATQFLSDIQNLQNVYKMEFPNVNYDSSSLEACIMKNAESSKNMQSKDGNCNMLIPYNTFNVRRINRQIKLKYIRDKDLYIESFKHSYLSKILEVLKFQVTTKTK